MANTNPIREGMQVYGAGDQLIGTVEQIDGDGFDVAEYRYSRDMVARVAQNRVYVRGTGMARTASQATQDNTLRVPLVEERLAVGTRETEIGEVAIRKTVTAEERTVPVTLRHEEVRVEERTVAERPATDDNLFKEQMIRVPLRGEEAVIATEAFVTGEVVVEKDQIVEERQITDTVRRQHVDVDKSEATTRTRGSEVREVGRTAPAAAQTTTTTGRSQLREGLAVLGSDQGHIGSIKEVRADDFLVNRRMHRDIYVPFTAIRDVTAEGVVLTVASSAVGDQGWPNP